MSTPQPLPPDGDPTENVAAAEQAPSPPQQEADIDTTRAEDELPERSPSS